jgi:hypothetical protein
MTEQRGKIVVQGIGAGKFWIRALDLTTDIENARALIDDKIRTQRKWAVVPVIAEHELTPDFKFAYVIVFEVDQLGLKNAYGAIYFASPKHWEQIRKARDHVARPIMQALEKGRFDEVVVLPDKKEL